MQIIYRPERETPARTGARYIHNWKLNPGLNQQLDPDFVKYVAANKDQGELAEFIKATVIELIEEPSQEEPVKETKPKRTAKKLEEAIETISE